MRLQINHLGAISGPLGSFLRRLRVQTCFFGANRNCLGCRREVCRFTLPELLPWRGPFRCIWKGRALVRCRGFPCYYQLQTNGPPKSWSTQIHRNETASNPLGPRMVQKCVQQFETLGMPPPLQLPDLLQEVVFSNFLGGKGGWPHTHRLLLSMGCRKALRV